MATTATPTLPRPGFEPAPQFKLLLVGTAIGLALAVFGVVAACNEPTQLSQLPIPGGLPSGFPTDFPTALPTGFPTALPTDFPTDFPGLPTGLPNVPGNQLGGAR